MQTEVNKEKKALDFKVSSSDSSLESIVVYSSNDDMVEPSFWLVCWPLSDSHKFNYFYTFKSIISSKWIFLSLSIHWYCCFLWYCYLQLVQGMQ